MKLYNRQKLVYGKILAMITNMNSFRLVPWPKIAKFYPPKWVLRLERGQNGSISDYKAILELHGDFENKTASKTYCARNALYNCSNLLLLLFRKET